MTQLLIYNNISGLDILKSSIATDVKWTIVNNTFNLSTHPTSNITRLGLMFDNKFPTIPFGISNSKSLEINGKSFIYFSKDLYNYLDKFRTPIKVDLITCNLNSLVFVSEINQLKKLLPNVSINYSINKTGGEIDSDWIMESNQQSIKTVYFNENIINYKYSLGGTSNHSGFVMKDNTVQICGADSVGQLGTGTFNNSTNLLSYIPNISNAQFISCGHYNTAILLSNGTIMTCGLNDGFGSLGVGDSSSIIFSATPLLVPGINNAIDISYGALHAAVVLSTGTVMTFGSNSFGQLGIGNNVGENRNRSIPAYLLNATRSRSVACGEFHTMIVQQNGTLYGCGLNTNGQLGFSSAGTGNELTPVLIPNVMNVVSVACGYYHTVVLLSNGNVLTFGLNDYGQLGTGNTINQSTPYSLNISTGFAIACGGFSTYIVFRDGTVKAAGQNIFGQLGNGTTINKNTFDFVMADNSQPITDIIAVAAGETHVTLLQKNGSVTSFGSNVSGELGYDNSGVGGTVNPIPKTITFLDNKMTFRVFDSLISSNINPNPRFSIEMINTILDKKVKTVNILPNNVVLKNITSNKVIPRISCLNKCSCKICRCKICSCKRKY